MENNEKSFEDKNIIERHTVTLPDGKKQVNIGNALLEQGAITKDLSTRVAALEEAMSFFSNWYNKTQRTEILLPNSLDESGNKKIIL